MERKNVLGVSRTKEEYVACCFVGSSDGNEVSIRKRDQAVQQKNMLKSSGSVIQQDGEFDEDVMSRISCGCRSEE